VVLGNAIYFKGKWDEPFSKKCTRNKPFYRLDGGNVDVPFMESGLSQFIAVHDGFKPLRCSNYGTRWQKRKVIPLATVRIDAFNLAVQSSYNFFSDIDRLCEGVL
jgi:hypothetical protein